MKLIYSLALVIVACLFLTGALLVIPEKETLTLAGLVQSHEMKDTSRFGGRVKEVLVKEGDMVETGQVLIRFDDTELRARIAQAQATLTQAKAQEKLLNQGADASDIRQAFAGVQQAEQNLRMTIGSGSVEVSQLEAKLQNAESVLNKAKTVQETAPQLLEEGIISQQKYNDIMADYESAKSAYRAAEEALKQAKQGTRREQVNIARSRLESARASYEKVLKGARKEELEIAMASISQAESELEALQAQLKEMEVRARIPGVVSVLNVLPGGFVLPGQPVVSIIDYNNLWADVYVPEDKLYMVEIDQPVDVTAIAFNNKVHFPGEISTINPKSEFVPSSQTSMSSEDSAFRVKVRIGPKARNRDISLYPGMKVNVRFSRNR